MAELPLSPPPAAPSKRGSSSLSRPAPAPSRGLRLALGLLTLSLVGCDHATKVAAEASLSHGRVVDVVSGVLELRYAANDDTAFSLLRTFGVARMPSLLAAAAGVALLAIVALWVARRKRASRAQHVGFALIVAGALGNLVDRVMRGYVVDFIHVTRWPVFNVADVAVVLGSIVLLLCAWLPERARAAPG